MKTITVKKTIEVEPCERCDGYIDGLMWRLVSTSTREDGRDHGNAEGDVLIDGIVCGKCLEIVKNSLIKRTRKPKPTPEGGA